MQGRDLRIMALPLLFVGIDVSKASLDVWIESQKSSESFGNDPDGWKALIDRLAALGAAAGIVVAFEATGGYERGLREALLRAGLQVRRLNPARVRLYARSLGQLAKNDRIDARIIARYAQTADLHPEVLDPARERLADLVAHRRRLIDERTAIGNQLETTSVPELRAHHCQRLAVLAKQTEETDRLIAEAVAQEPTLLAKVALLKTLKGVKDVTAITLIALLPELGTLTDRAIASLAGLAPFDHDSGRYKGQRRIGGGRRAVRTALYMAARAAARSKSPLGEFYNRLRERGKSAKTATVALMRKMLVILNAILRDQQPWSHATAP
jgi:transposase